MPAAPTRLVLILVTFDRLNPTVLDLDRVVMVVQATLSHGQLPHHIVTELEIAALKAR